MIPSSFLLLIPKDKETQYKKVYTRMEAALKSENENRLIKNFKFESYITVESFFKNINNYDLLIIPLEVMFNIKSYYKKWFRQTLTDFPLIPNNSFSLEHFNSKLSKFKAFLTSLNIDISNKQFIFLVKIPFNINLSFDFDLNKDVNFMFYYDLTDLILNIRELDKSKGNNSSLTKEIMVKRALFYTNHISEFEPRSLQTADLESELDFLTKILSKFNPKIVIDMCCGNGRLTFPLATQDFLVLGMDINKDLLQQAKAKYRNLVKTKNISNFSETQILNIKNNISFQELNLFNLHNISLNEKNLEWVKMLNNTYNYVMPSSSLLLQTDVIILFWHSFLEVMGSFLLLLNEVRKIIRVGGLFIFDCPVQSTHSETNGLIPNLRQILELLASFDFRINNYSKVNWGVEKWVFECEKLEAYYENW